MSAELVSIDALSAEAGEDDNAFTVDLDGYEGPLHLLLELARRQKVNLLKVSMLEIANQYLDFIDDAKTKRIDLAADYLLMAAWLTFMKSRLLLPKPPKAEKDEISGEDMAMRLAFRLRRLGAMRDAGEALMSGPVLDNVVFLRGAPEQPTVIKHTEYDTSMWHMMQAFGAIRKRKEGAKPHRVEHQFVLPLESARKSLRRVAANVTDWSTLEDIRIALSDLNRDVPKASVTASVFSAALELTRDGEVDVRQDAHWAPLYLKGTGQAPGSYDTSGEDRP